jgi:hypothetical protein
MLIFSKPLFGWFKGRKNKKKLRIRGRTIQVLSILQSLCIVVSHIIRTAQGTRKFTRAENSRVFCDSHHKTDYPFGPF